AKCVASGPGVDGDLEVELAGGLRCRRTNVVGRDAGCGEVATAERDAGPLIGGVERRGGRARLHGGKNAHERLEDVAHAELSPVSSHSSVPSFTSASWEYCARVFKPGVALAIVAAPVGAMTS